MPAPILNNAPATDAIRDAILDPLCDPPTDSAFRPDVTPPAAAGLQLWLASPQGLRHFDPATLTASDRRRFDAMRNPRRREEFAVSRALLAHAGIAAPSLSLSHSGGHAALVWGPADCEVGVDLEQHRPRDAASIAQFAFSRAESDALLALTSLQRERMFYSLWVMKEAMAKALQLPLLAALRSCVFRWHGGWSGAVPTQRPWSLIVLEPRPGMSLAVACVGDDGAAAFGLEILEWPPGYPARRAHTGSRVTIIASSTAAHESPSTFAAMRQNPGESSTCRTVLPTP